MSAERMAALVPGLYEALVTQHLEKSFTAFPELAPIVEKFDDNELNDQLADHLAQVYRHALRSCKTRAEKLALAHDIIRRLGEDYLPDLPSPEPRLLTEVKKAGSAHSLATPRPATPLNQVALLTNATDEPSIGAELRQELASADRVDLICAFIKWAGIRTMDKELAELKTRNIPFRVITTTYVGATERLALDRIVKEYGGEVKISYDTKSTRLHAKAWHFHRDSGFSTAYVGSSNLSKTALLDGLEWNVRLSAAATPSLIRKFEATFESYWNEKAFEPYDPVRDGERLEQEIQRGAFVDSGTVSADLSGLEVRPFPHQVLMLEDLEAARATGKHDNLLVAATGTGKTVIAALDYGNLLGNRQPQELKLLFVAHRKEILEQARRTYRNVLSDGAFGELFVDGQKPTEWNHVFASVQSLSSLGASVFDPSHFDVIVIDEFHHADARTYRALIDHFQPHEWLGLTATPERADGVNVADFFGGRATSELRLWDALEADILVPFHYFGIADETPLNDLTWHGRAGYNRSELSNVYTGNDLRTRIVLKALKEKVGNLSQLKAIGFCVSVEHAEYMAQAFKAAGIPSASITGGTQAEDRTANMKKLKSGEIKVIFSVDVFNEGLDVPQINTVLFLRPTESATIFLQQLGRGLRRSHGKTVLTVLDFVGHQHKKFRFDQRLRALTGSTNRQLRDDLENDFPFLPAGSQIVFDKVAKEAVLDNIKGQLNLTHKQLIEDISWHAKGRSITEYRLAEYLRDSGHALTDIYKTGGGYKRSWNKLFSLANKHEPADSSELDFTSNAAHLRHVDDRERAHAYLELLSSAVPYDHLPADLQTYARMLFLTAVHRGGSDTFASFAEGLEWVRSQRLFRAEVKELFAYLEQQRVHSVPQPIELGRETVLKSHASYLRAEVLAALDIATWEKKQSSHVAGVAYSPVFNTDIFLVTLNKDTKRFTPNTKYRDYAISPEKFHWESQNSTTAGSLTGRRYLNKSTGDSYTLILVRESATDATGLAQPFFNLGTVQFNQWAGTERPMPITWDLDRAMPMHVFQKAKAVN